MCVPHKLCYNHINNTIATYLYVELAFYHLMRYYTVIWLVEIFTAVWLVKMWPIEGLDSPHTCTCRHLTYHSKCAIRVCRNRQWLGFLNTTWFGCNLLPNFWRGQTTTGCNIKLQLDTISFYMLDMVHRLAILWSPSQNLALPGWIAIVLPPKTGTVCSLLYHFQWGCNCFPYIAWKLIPNQWELG